MTYTIRYTQQNGKIFVYRNVESYDVDDNDFLVFVDVVTNTKVRKPKILCEIDEVLL